MAAENDNKSTKIGLIRKSLLIMALAVLAVELIRVFVWVAWWRGFWGAFVHGAVWYKLGELFVFGPLLVLIFLGSSLDRKHILTFINGARWLFWIGAALNAAALVDLSGNIWWSPWLLIVAVVGIFSPIMLNELTAKHELGRARLLSALLAVLFVFNYAINIPITGGLVVELPTPNPRSTDDRDRRWQQDLRYLTRELPRLHFDLFREGSKEDFYRGAAELEEAIPSLEDHQIFVAMMKMVASIGDPHTNLKNWGARYHFRCYPLGLIWQPEGVMVNATDENNREALGMRVRQIGSCDIESACDKVAELMAHTDKTVLYTTAPDLLMRPEVLHALKIIDNMDSARFVLEDSLQQTRAFVVTPRDLESIDWVRRTPRWSLWLENPNAPFWYRKFEKLPLLYFKYNNCWEEFPNQFSEFCDNMFQKIDDPASMRIVVDFRRNGGGSTILFDDFLKRLREFPDVIERGHVIGIIDRNASGAAITGAIQLQREMNALFFGEAPDVAGPIWNESNWFDLPNTEAPVFYPQVQPDTRLPLTDSLRIDIRTLPRPIFKRREYKLDETMDSVWSYVQNQIRQETDSTEVAGQ